MKLTPKQIESLEKLATILPDFLSTLKITLEDPIKVYSKEDIILLDESIGKLLELSTDYFQYKDRSQDKISLEDLEREQKELFTEDPTWQPIIDMAKTILKDQAKERIYTALLPVYLTKHLNSGLQLESETEIFAKVNIYSDWILKNCFQEDLA